MITFIDINTGKTFSGNPPYTFWFDGGQSTLMNYSQQICFIAPTEQVEVSIENTEVFWLLDAYASNYWQDEKDWRDEKIWQWNGGDVVINGFQYKDLDFIKATSITSIGENIGGYWVHSIYILANSQTAGQIQASFSIGDESFVVGGDFYDEDETLLINLANQGQEIPESVQRAIYTSNVHEEGNDNILLNRKWKELLMNSWDTFVSKGSYKSLINTLEWFEWGDKLNVSEYWKFMIGPQEYLKEQDINPIMPADYSTTLVNYTKTAYIGLHCPIHEMINYEHDEELNPIIREVAFDWSLRDLGIKLSLLGNFYKTYFMPIHLSLIHSTLENISFSYSMKALVGMDKLREDYSYKLDSFKCNMKPEYIMSNVHTQVGLNTPFGHYYDALEQDDWSNYDKVYTIGVETVVDSIVRDGMSDDDAAKTFWSQYINFYGVIVPIDCNVELEPGDVIHHEIMAFKNNIDEERIYEFHNLFGNPETTEKQNVRVLLNLYYVKPGIHNISIQFITAGGKTHTKTISFNIVDNGIPRLKIYKVKSDEYPLNYHKETFSDHTATYFNPSTPESLVNMSGYVKCYVPYQPGTSGVRLNNVLVLNCNLIDLPSDTQTEITDNYFYYVRTDKEEAYHYTVCVSREFEFDARSMDCYNSITSYIVRNSQEFFPEFHHLDEICKDNDDNIENFMINSKESMCVVPVFDDGINCIPIKYTKLSEDCGWEFINKSTGSVFRCRSFQTPVISNSEYGLMDPGYYDIVFKYKLSDGVIHELRRDSAVIISR